MAVPEMSEGSSSPTSTGNVEGGSQFCLCQPEPKIPRPRNAFILYRQHQQAAVVRANPGLPNPAISKIIGEQWSRLPEDAKNEWKALAEEEKARQAQQYPDYRYQPRRNGRYSSQSSGSGPPSNSQVDEQGNCKKCGGKTMNPPATPYNPYPTTPRGPPPQMPRGSQPIVSPPQSSRPSYPDRHWPPGPPRFDPRDPRNHDPRSRYSSLPDGPPDAPDLKRRRFDGNGIYIPTREWREAPYQYSPRGSFFRAEMPPDGHRPSIPGGPRATYAQPPAAHPPRLSLARPPPPPQQHKRDPSLTLPPLTTASSNQPPSTSSPPGLEAMIMSIPVLNKVKILAQISPHLAPPNMDSPPQPVRGSVVAIEGMDPTAVYSMTNSLAEELEKDGKFAVRIFGGPDSYSLRGENSRASKRLSIAETLSVIGEWHKISEEMRKFITTQVSPSSEGSMSASDRPRRESMIMMDAPASSDPQKTPERGAAIKVSEVEHSFIENDEDAEKLAATIISPGTISQTADLKLATPPSQRHAFSGRTASIAAFSINQSKETDDAPYTRIPAAAMQRPGTPPRATRSASNVSNSNKQFDTVPPPRSATSSQPPTPSISAPATGVPPVIPVAVTPSDHATSVAKSALPSPGLASPGPIPIALVPHYQLTTVDSAAITLPINDSYSPLAHWQWLATLWRGCIGPDVSIVINGPTGSVSEASAGAQVDAEKASPNSAGTKDAFDKQGEKNKDSEPKSQGPNDPARASNANTGTDRTSTSSVRGGSQGVDVRLLECRAVVVRMDGSVGKDLATAKDRENAEFWEKAKRRVGFEVGEFLRR